jgi:hypothetical protein
MLHANFAMEFLTRIWNFYNPTKGLDEATKMARYFHFARCEIRFFVLLYFLRNKAHKVKLTASLYVKISSNFCSVFR